MRRSRTSLQSVTNPLVCVPCTRLYSSLLFRYGKVEGVKILPQRYPNQGVAAFIDFYDVRSAVEAREAKIVYQGCELRTNFKTKATERFDKYEHSLRRDPDYMKEPPYSGKRVGSITPPPEREKELKEKIRDKEKSRGKERYWLPSCFCKISPLAGLKKCALIRVSCSALLLEF